MNFFEHLISYEDYLLKHPFHNLLGIKLDIYGRVNRKIERSLSYSIDQNSIESISAELDDLVRLHYLVTSRKVTTILEFGVGKSSIVFDHALNFNKQKHSSFVRDNLRRSNPFQCFSVDNNNEWISKARKIADTSLVDFHFSRCSVSTFNGRICTFYDELPNVCPDLIYLDGPDQYSTIGDIRGVSTNHPDRLPMSADILAIEHFLLPGTLIVVDGRASNARFLKANLQRDWTYFYHDDFDQHFFELTEKPIGRFNKRQIDYCLGADFYQRSR